MRSFSLIELMIVMSIIFILSVFIIPNFHLADSRIALDRAAYTLAQSIRSVEEMSMSSRVTDPAIFGSNLFPQGGYGLYFLATSSSGDTKSYIIFADCDGDGQYNVNGGGNAASCSQATKSNAYHPEQVTEVALDNNIRIKQTGGNQLESIIFLPPDPKVIMKPSLNSYPTITLYNVREIDRKLYICINNVGTIDIRNEDCPD